MTRVSDTATTTGGLSQVIFDPDRRYRYSLTRAWTNRGADPSWRALWIMLKPSTADEHVDDPTIRKVRGFTQRLGLDGFTVVNLYPLRATKPKDLWAQPLSAEAVATNRDYLIRELGTRYPHKIIAWGGHAKPPEVHWLMWRAYELGVALTRLGTTKGGMPRHPLMLPYAALDNREILPPEPPIGPAPNRADDKRAAQPEENPAAVEREHEGEPEAGDDFAEHDRIVPRRRGREVT